MRRRRSRRRRVRSGGAKAELELAEHHRPRSRRWPRAKARMGERLVELLARGGELHQAHAVCAVWAHRHVDREHPRQQPRPWMSRGSLAHARNVGQHAETTLASPPTRALLRVVPQRSWPSSHRLPRSLRFRIDLPTPRRGLHGSPPRTAFPRTSNSQGWKDWQRIQGGHPVVALTLHDLGPHPPRSRGRSCCGRLSSPHGTGYASTSHSGSSTTSLYSSISLQ
jgi:hypothetical protein